jgi:glycosyltransferase involved in cell wall biosynthesis
MKPKLSVVIPIRDEQDNILPLAEKLTQVLDLYGKPYEVIWVDDGSMDLSFKQIETLTSADSRMKSIRFRRPFGQTAALAAGFKAASGEVIVPMDGDGQNDPGDIPKLVQKLEEGYDVVAGWRRNRKDPLLSRRLPSWIANGMIVMITGIRIHDSGCTMKAIRRDILDNIQLYGEMHRFIPALTQWMGAKIAEVEISHHPRLYGKTKYNIIRTFRVVLDLINVKFLLRYFTRPIQLFGSLGILGVAAGFISAFIAVYLKIFYGKDITGNPWLYLAILGIIVGVQFIMMGLLGEIGVRTYYESQQKPIYVIKETRNLEGDDVASPASGAGSQ